MLTPACPSTGSAADFLPARRVALPALARAAEKCQGCQLYCHATQVVFGEGPAHAPLMLVGEQPGDQEDKAGRPFVGPSGRILDESLAAAKLDRSTLYVTNAVKHFKWELGGERGKRRLHKKPTWTEIVACRPWLLKEIELVQPRIIVALGATAAQSLLGKTFRLTQHRGAFQPFTESAELAPKKLRVLATLHPSSLLRMPDEAARRAAKEEFIRDFQLIARSLR